MHACSHGFYATKALWELHGGEALQAGKLQVWTYRMCNACSSRKVLHTSSGQRLFVSHAVLMTELALHNICEDLCISVWVLSTMLTLVSDSTA